MRISEAVRRLEARFDAKRWLSQFEPKEQGDNWILECDACGKEKLYIYVGKATPEKSPGTWICFYCDEAGTALDLIRQVGGLSLFQAADVLREFSSAPERSGLEDAVARAFAALPAKDVEAVPEVKACEMPDGFIPCRADKRLPAYFAERGIDRLEAARRHLGWCESGRYANRLIVPVFRRGVPAWFQARWMAKQPPVGQKKYLNSYGADSSQDLYGIDRWSRSRRIVLVEDVFSALWVGKGAVATFGTHFSRAQLRLLGEADAHEIVVCWDPDALDKAYALAGSLSELWSVSVVHLPVGKDPDDLSREDVRRRIDEAVSVDVTSSFHGAARARLAQI